MFRHRTAKVAHTAAPLLHRRLSLEHRCEVAVTGFLLVDLFRLTADQKCSKLKLPKGSLFMAGQTSTALQLCALSAALICITKTDDFEPFRTGFGRISELPIEQHFSFLRQQSSNSQLGARAYFQASARQTLRLNKFLEKEPVPKKGEPALTEKKLLVLALCKQFAQESQFVRPFHQYLSIFNDGCIL